MREGSLEAPKRHPLDWRSEAFYDQGELTRELERVFDICHGCRRCVNLCSAFPTLFDMVDESKTLEIDGVDKKDFRKVVDRPVSRQMAEFKPDYISSDCPIAARHIVQGMRAAGEDPDVAAGTRNGKAPAQAAGARKAHPLTLLRKAYGI